jgi:hypothetical protein
MEGEIQKLVVAVTQAAGPRKTDWQTIFAAIALILAIGSAAFWPMSQTLQENKVSIQSLEQKYADHSKAANHPVGDALIQRLEEQLKTHEEWGERNHEIIQTQIKENSITFQKQLDEKLEALQERTTFSIDKLYSRIIELENQSHLDIERGKNELQLWRQKAMGLNTFDVTTYPHTEKTTNSTK